jgi:hypothetical protein
MMQRPGQGRVSSRDICVSHSESYNVLFFILLTSARSERLIELLREFPPEEPSRKRFISEMISWSSKFGPLEAGDPELHHAAGSVYAEGRS